MGKAYKVVITGAFNAGKTLFIHTISEIPVVSTERRISDDLSSVKEETTVAMDYGQVTMDGNLLHLFGTPGQERFNFMWDILVTDTDMLLLLIDSTARSTFATARQLLRQLRRKKRVPFLIVANKQDERKAMSTADLAKSLKLDDPSLVVPCDARDKDSVRAVLTKAMDYLR
jgi:small GTP-binding protein